MRAFTLACLTAAALGTTALLPIELASAMGHQVVLQKTYSRLQLFQACKQSGGAAGNTGSPGTNYTTDNMDANYSCNNLDKGTSVECSPKTGKCVGTTPE